MKQSGNRIVQILLIILFSLFFIATTFLVSDTENQVAEHRINRPFIKIKLTDILDTIFTTKDSYLTVNLKKQRLSHHFRDGRVFEYLCSTGNPHIEEGMATNEGIFVIQYKSPKVYSTQFDSTLLLNWMGFNHGIGIHALLGSAYYRTLGKRAASHGCVRIGREDCTEIYRSVEIGTAMMVHSENNARVISFTDDLERFSSPSKKELILFTNRNLEILYSGRALIKQPDKLIISEDNVTHNGISIGDKSSAPKKQYYIPPLKFIPFFIADNLRTNKMTKLLLDSLNLN